jgi:hypothetical protein
MSSSRELYLSDNMIAHERYTRPRTHNFQPSFIVVIIAVTQHFLPRPRKHIIYDMNSFIETHQAENAIFPDFILKPNSDLTLHSPEKPNEKVPHRQTPHNASITAHLVNILQRRTIQHPPPQPPRLPHLLWSWDPAWRELFAWEPQKQCYLYLSRYTYTEAGQLRHCSVKSREDWNEHKARSVMLGGLIGRSMRRASGFWKCLRMGRDIGRGRRIGGLRGGNGGRWRFELELQVLSVRPKSETAYRTTSGQSLSGSLLVEMQEDEFTPH